MNMIRKFGDGVCGPCRSASSVLESVLVVGGFCRSNFPDGTDSSSTDAHIPAHNRKLCFFFFFFFFFSFFFGVTRFAPTQGPHAHRIGDWSDISLSRHPKPLRAVVRLRTSSREQAPPGRHQDVTAPTGVTHAVTTRTASTGSCRTLLPAGSIVSRTTRALELPQPLGFGPNDNTTFLYGCRRSAVVSKAPGEWSSQ